MNEFDAKNLFGIIQLKVLFMKTLEEKSFLIFTKLFEFDNIFIKFSKIKFNYKITSDVLERFETNLIF